MGLNKSKKVLILPWYWAKKGQVTKYCHLYKELGYQPQVYWAGLIKNFIPSQMRQVGYDQSTYEWRRQTHFHAVHAFSGGIYSYFSFLHSPTVTNDITNSHPPRLNYSKLIIDGGPIIPNHPVIDTVFRHAFGYPNANPIYFKPFVALWFLNRKRIIQKGFPIDQLSTLTAQIPVPKLVLNCPDDEYTDQKHIEKFLRECQTLSPDYQVISHIFQNSKHCQNYRYYPELYREIVADFLHV